MTVPVDERALRGLMEESADLHADAMRSGRADLADYADAVRDTHSPLLKAAGFAAVAFGTVSAGVLGSAGSAWAAAEMDVMALQTAASLENLAVATYKTALTLPFIGGSSANKVVQAFANKTMAQHDEHAQAFNAALTKLGAKTQAAANPKYAPVVKAAVPTIKGPADVVGLAITLEDVAAQTYVKNVGQVSTPQLRQLFASIAGVEAQHKAILLAVQALLKADASLIALPPDAAKLPDAAGGVGFPDAFYPTAMASPVEEGAVK
ncbi:ferritin-like domain-containing protein [Catelliglobosispora koreensis]|uniref:ferritin-like domain-containing protein n=1 Tax=Catelliglobosispora koreensis TaxID=129052 RepID=UPI0003705FFF|nr:ferritin-like domain-containing protein [Catelliglobosispora koreensis]